MNCPEKIRRPFTFEDLDGEPRTQDLEVTPGAVNVPGFGPVSWHHAQRLANEIRDAALAARLLADIRDQGRDNARICTRCNGELEDGIAVVQDEEDPERLRHAQGSPACARM